MSWIHTNYIKYPDYKQSLGKKLPKEQVNAVVNRLHVVNKQEQSSDTQEKRSRMSKEEIDDMVERLADKDKNLLKTPERDRTGALSESGVVNTYAWNCGKTVRIHPHRADGNFF